MNPKTTNWKATSVAVLLAIGVAAIAVGLCNHQHVLSDKFPDLMLNLGSELFGIVATVIFIDRILSFRRQPLKSFEKFFGKTSQQHDVTYIFPSFSSLSEPRVKYPHGDKLNFPPGETPPAPREVAAWLAHEDLQAATYIISLFGRMTSGQPQIVLDGELGNALKQGPTIAFGLGFNTHTRTLLQLGNFKEEELSLTWESLTPVTKGAQVEPGDGTTPGHLKSDGLRFRKKVISGTNSKDYAILARIIAYDHVHFVCAGRTACGTAVAGSYLAEHWQDIMALYERREEDSDSRNLAVLLEHARVPDLPLRDYRLLSAQIADSQYIFGRAKTPPEDAFR